MLNLEQHWNVTDCSDFLSLWSAFTFSLSFCLWQNTSEFVLVLSFPPFIYFILLLFFLCHSVFFFLKKRSLSPLFTTLCLRCAFSLFLCRVLLHKNIVWFKPQLGEERRHLWCARKVNVRPEWVAMRWQQSVVFNISEMPQASIHTFNVNVMYGIQPRKKKRPINLCIPASF